MIDPTELSEIARAILARQRKTYEFDVGPYVGLGETVSKIAVRVPTKREQDIALVGAHEYVAQLSAKTPAVKDDPEILLDAKAAFIVAVACRRAEEPEKMPAWPSGGWLSENLTSDQISVLLNLVNQVRAKESPTPTQISEEQIEAFIAMAALASGTELPDIALAGLPQVYVVQLFVMTAMKLAEARKQLAQPKPSEHED